MKKLNRIHATQNLLSILLQEAFWYARDLWSYPISGRLRQCKTCKTVGNSANIITHVSSWQTNTNWKCNHIIGLSTPSICKTMDIKWLSKWTDSYRKVHSKISLKY